MKARSLYRTALRELAKDYSVEGCLAYGELVLGHQPYAHHRELVAAELHAVSTGEDTLILEPRGGGKTLWGNTGFLAWLIAMQPHIRVGLFSETSSFSESFSRAIMNIYESNEEHRLLFGDLVGGKWTNSEWIRRGSLVSQTKDLTLFAGGTGGQVASKRFDVLCLDDILGEGNTSTSDQREKVLEWFDKTLYPCLVASGVCIAFGTVWAPEDLYQTLMNPVIPIDPETSPGYGFNTIVRRALLTPDPDDPSTWSSYWPDQWPLEELLKRRARNIARFDASYQNDVTGLLSGGKFQRLWFRYFGTPHGDPDKELREFRQNIVTRRIGVDLAFSKRDRADFTAEVTTAEDAEGDFYVLRATRDKIDVGHDDFIVHAFDVTPGVGAVVIESNQAQSVVVQMMMKDHSRVPVISHNADNDKITRAAAVSERYKSRKVWHHISLKDSAFERELTAFDGRRGHDDWVDALGYSMSLGGSKFFFGRIDVRRRR